VRKTTIGIIGSSAKPGRDISLATVAAAEEVGRLVAERGAVLVNGGTSGIMEASARGAQQAGGLTIGFLPQGDYSHANAYLDIAFPTGMGTMRNVLTSRGCDAVIMLGGGAGTLNEVTLAYDFGTPVIVLRGTSGWSDRLEESLFDGKWLDDREVVPIVFADTPEDVVDAAFAATTTTRQVSAVHQAFAGAAGD